MSRFKREYKVLNNIAEEIEELKMAKDLLDSLYARIGPYKDGDIPEDIWNNVKDFYGFSDSE